MSWVKNVVRQFGRILVKCIESDGKLGGLRKEIPGDAAGVSIVLKASYCSYALCDKG